ncbi:hypothetical protein ACIBL3_01075 [Kribbella sp. NPDC050124]|uniref:hypothetical protein n=1 Tax=Kribbella sp. NPDC050124 TaxID=3364114 RepID=UPI0037BAE312
MTEQQGNNSGEDRPGPYQGVFGAPGGPPAPGSQPPGGPPYGDRPGTYGDRPGAYRGAYGAGQNPYAQKPGPPKQVTIASVISLGLGALCILLGGLALTSAGEQVAEIVAGSKDAKGLVVGVILVCAVAYILPAIYIRRRHAWARYMLIAVAATGIAGGLMALPNSILGLAIHVTLLVLMLQQPTKLWFHHR